MINETFNPLETASVDAILREADKALHCLSLAVPVEIQFDLSEKVQRGFEALIKESEAASQKLDRMEHARDCWRKAATRLQNVMGSGNAKGRPMDLVNNRDWAWIMSGLKMAEDADTAARPPVVAFGPPIDD